MSQIVEKCPKIWTVLPCSKIHLW